MKVYKKVGCIDMLVVAADFGFGSELIDHLMALVVVVGVLLGLVDRNHTLADTIKLRKR